MSWPYPDCDEHTHRKTTNNALDVHHAQDKKPTLDVRSENPGDSRDGLWPDSGGYKDV